MAQRPHEADRLISLGLDDGIGARGRAARGLAAQGWRTPRGHAFDAAFIAGAAAHAAHACGRQRAARGRHDQPGQRGRGGGDRES